MQAMGQQLVHVATGEGTNVWIGHTYGIIERYIPCPGRADARGAATESGPRFREGQLAARLRRARRDAGTGRVARDMRSPNRRLDDLTLLAATVTLALLGNAFICAVSGRTMAMARG